MSPGGLDTFRPSRGVLWELGARRIEAVFAYCLVDTLKVRPVLKVEIEARREDKIGHGLAIIQIGLQ
jgi:uncharacterized protein involved in copper resistance